MDWLAPAQAAHVPSDELAPADEGIPEWLAPESIEMPSEQAAATAPAGLEAESSEWLFEVTPPEPPGPIPSEPGELAMEMPSEPEWMRPAVEQEPAAGSPRAETAIPEWLREPVEPPSTTLPEEPTTAGPIEPIVFEGQGEEAGPAVVVPEEPHETAAVPVALQPEPTPVPAAVEVPVPPAEVLVSGPAHVQGKQAVRPEQLLESARQSLAAGDIDAAVRTYAKLAKKRNTVAEVISDLQPALDRAPNMPALWQVLGDAYMRANQTAEAIEAYRRGLSSI
jgi:hypothetical protein